MNASTRHLASSLATRAALPPARIFPSLLLATLFGVACAQGNQSSQPNKTQAAGAAAVKTALAKNSSTKHTVRAADGTADAGTAQFDAPVIDPSTWQGTPAGTGSYSLGLASGTVSGGPQSASASGSDGTTLWHQVVIGDFSARTGNALFVEIDDATFATGTLTIDNTHVFAGLIDIATGNDLADAISGSLTLSAAGSAVGTRITGSLTGQFQVAPPTQTNPTCSTDRDCASGQTCVAGTCENTSTNGSCPASLNCVPGTCSCSVDSSGNPICGCETQPTTCSSDRDCTNGQSCINGACTGSQPPPPPPACSTNADCGSGGSCENGVCVSSSPGCAELQGSGSFTITTGASALCSALPAATTTVSAASLAMTQIDESGKPTIILGDSSNASRAELGIELDVCPSASTTLTIGSGVQIFAISTVQANANLVLYAEAKATGGTVTFASRNAGGLIGTVSATFDNGGTATATFDIQ